MDILPRELAKKRCSDTRPALAALMAILVFAGAGFGEMRSSDQRFLAGLRERRLFELAKTYCTGQLQDSSLPGPRRAELTIELSLALAEWALNSPPDEREPLWRESWQVTQEFLRRDPDLPQAVLVRLQGALGLLVRGELARQEAQVVADNVLLLEEARQWLREAIGNLRELDERLSDALRQQAMPGRAAPRGPSESLDRYELASVQRNVRYELARALRNQGESYPPDSPDRANSLTQAIQILDSLTKLEPDLPLVWKSRIDEIVCYRLLADDPTAGRKLEVLLTGNPPGGILLCGRAEKIRLALAEKRIEDALAVVAAGREAGGATSGDLDYAWVEVYLAAWHAATDAKDAAAAGQWQAKASQMVQQIEREHGPYWTRRAEMLLAGYVRAAPETGDLAMQVRAAESSYRSGRIDDALADYDRARATAGNQGDRARAFELGYTAAAIEHQRNRHAEALERYRRLAIDMPAAPKAAEAHSLAIYHAAQLAKTSPELLNRYIELLQEHLRTWPNAASADGVRWRLGGLREHQQDWQRAIAAYRDISPGDPKHAEAVAAAARCYRHWLEQSRSSGEPTEKTASEAAAWLESLALGPDRRLPERWSPVARTAVLEAARFRLDHTPDGPAHAEQLLSAALSGATDAPAEWQTAARSLLVFALAAQGRHREAMQAMEQMSAGSPGELLNLLGGLSRVAATARPEIRADLANLQLAAIERLEGRREQFSPADRRTYEFARAQALAGAGRVEEAGQALDSLAQAYPRDGEIQEAHAALLLAGTDRASLERSLAKWRQVEEKAAPASERWFRAKYNVASLHYRLGNREQAARIIRLLQIVHPELGGPERKRQFLELLAQATR